MRFSCNTAVLPDYIALSNHPGESDHPDREIVAGQVGTVICCFTVPNEAYEVEFIDDNGNPVAQFALLPDELEAYSL